MIGLQPQRLHHDIFWLFFEDVVGQEHQYGTYAFATHRQYIADGLVERGRASLVG